MKNCFEIIEFVELPNGGGGSKRVYKIDRLPREGRKVGFKPC